MPNAQAAQNFEPFPHGIGFNKAKGEQDLDLLVATLDLIPSVKVLQIADSLSNHLQEMQQYSSDAQLKAVLDDISPLCFPLLRWTIQSNRTHLSKIPPNKQIAVSNHLILII